MKKNAFLKILVAGILALATGAHAQENPPAKPEATKPASNKVKVTIETSKGTIELELDKAKAPVTVANFVSYVTKGHYEGTIFHRVIPGFMVQGGGFNPDMSQKPTDRPIPIESENGLKNSRGTIAMARTSDPNSATSQFFISVKDNAMLDYAGPQNPGYAVFGKVTKGMDVVDAIVGVPTTRKGPHADVPAEPISITKVTATE